LLFSNVQIYVVLALKMINVCNFTVVLFWQWRYKSYDLTVVGEHLDSIAYPEMVVFLTQNAVSIGQLFTVSRAINESCHKSSI